MLKSMEMNSPRTYGAGTFSLGTERRRLEGHKGSRTSESMPIRSAAVPLVQDASPVYGSPGIGGTADMVVEHRENNIHNSPYFSSFLFITMNGK